MNTNPILVSEDYTLVVETDHPAYQFADKLCAYVTGLMGEKDDVREYTDLFYLEMGISDDESPRGLLADEKNPFHGMVTDVAGERGYSPWTLWLSRKYGMNTNGEYAELTEKNYDEYNFPAPFGIGIFFVFQPTPELLVTIRGRADKFFSEIGPKIGVEAKVEGIRLIRTRKYAEELPC